MFAFLCIKCYNKYEVIYMNEIFEEIKRITESFIEDGERFIEERKAMKDDNI